MRFGFVSRKAALEKGCDAVRRNRDGERDGLAETHLAGRLFEASPGYQEKDERQGERWAKSAGSYLRLGQFTLIN